MEPLPLAMLERFLADHALAAPAGWPDAVDSFYRALAAANRQTNLTRLTGADDFACKHLADSWLGAVALPALLAAPLRVADIGCGAGIPGIPLAMLCPQATFCEIEAIGKKIAFVEAAIGALGLGDRVRAVRGRAREVARLPEFAASFEVVLARAVSEMAELVRECRQLLRRPGGLLLAYKTPAAIAEERPLAERECAKASLTLAVSPVYHLPGDAGDRQFFLARYLP